MVGRKAEVRTALNPKGTVFLEGELWAAVSETGNIEPGTQVVITRVEGLILYVAKKV
jgi:membrane-bound ClpP family serine protease